MSASTQRTLSTLIAASLLLLASACTDSLGPNAGPSNIEQGNPNQPTVSEPGGGFNENGEPEERRVKGNVQA